MNKDIKAKWCAWLRDPENKQTQGALQKDGRFCCLGGLCEVYREETGKGEWREHAMSYSDFGEPRMKFSFLDAVGTLPHEVVSWAGIMNYYDVSDPEVLTPFGRYKLSTLNDGFIPGPELETRRLTFAEIADIIEANPDL